MSSSLKKKGARMNSKRHIIVGGKAYADIDVLACASAYQELLTLKGYQAEGVITAPWNQTIPASMREWPIHIHSTFIPSPSSCNFILVDISDPRFVEEFVTIENVVEVYDHHFGHETYWQVKLPQSTHIEQVGACATLIWEQFKHASLHHSISKNNANLLYTAIFANTLNFQSHITSHRDSSAAEELQSYIDLPLDWKESYYKEIEEGFNQNLVEQLHKDTKTIDYQGSSFFFGQIELWNAASIIQQFKQLFIPLKLQGEWLVNIVSIQEGFSYLYTNSIRIKEMIKQNVETSFLTSSLQVTDRLWLRKELLREFLQNSKKFLSFE
jgi:inorganic pyrophosphatase/exopolyphosphatase